MLTALIVDDEHCCCSALASMLTHHCSGVQVVRCCHSGGEAIVAIRELRPALVFLDVELPDMSGFKMLEQLTEFHFGLVITTAYDHYVLKALRLSAVDYLLKPIDTQELLLAMQRAERSRQCLLAQQTRFLLQHMAPPVSRVQKIALPTIEGLQLVSVDTVISCASDSNYTILLLKNKQKLVVSRTLKEVEELLETFAFVRVHRSHLVNINEISKYVRGEGGYLVMSDGSHIDVSRNNKEILLRSLLQLRA